MVKNTAERAIDISETTAVRRKDFFILRTPYKMHKEPVRRDAGTVDQENHYAHEIYREMWIPPVQRRRQHESRIRGKRPAHAWKYIDRLLSLSILQDISRCIRRQIYA